MQTVDCVIVGSGMAGLCLANLLQKESHLSVALIGMKKPQADQPGHRVCALNHRSTNILARAGLDKTVWQTIPHGCYQTVFIWQHGQGSLRFDAQDLQFDDMGRVAHNANIEYALWQQLQHDALQVYMPAIAVALRYDGGMYHITLEDGRVLQTPLLFGADGKQSWVRSALSIETTQQAYNQMAIVATLRCSKSHQHTAWQHFLETGPVAFLPLDDPQCLSIVWSAKTHEAERLMALDEAGFIAALQQVSPPEIGSLTLASKRFCYPLEAQHACRYIGTHAALLGDAAHVAHPLAGQGVNAGIVDAAVLTDVINQAHQTQRPLQQAFIRYQKLRRLKNSGLITAMGQIDRLFASRNPVLGFGRKFGMRIIDQSPLLKRQLAEVALGLSRHY